MTDQTLFSSIEQAPADPILGITEKFLADKNPQKINLGVGVYQNELGKAAKLKAVIKAEQKILESDVLATYSPIDGLADCRTIVQRCLFGEGSEVITNGRAATCQSPGGTGAIRIGADFLKLFAPGRDVYISDPSWENHKAIFEAVGAPVHSYPYYKADSKSLDFDGCFKTLEGAKNGSVIILHAACHNPTGYDFSPEQWAQVITLCETKNFIPFLDFAYQGFDRGFEEDAWVIKDFAKRGIPFLIASSFSKNFGLYAERIGALTIVCSSKDIATRAQSQLKRIIRTIYSNPPARGAKIIQTIFADPALREEWLQELTFMRTRMQTMRGKFVAALAKSVADFDFSHIAKQNGMFSYSGLSKKHVVWLRENKSLYALESGRICIAALNDGNLDIVVQNIADAIKAA